MVNDSFLHRNTKKDIIELLVGLITYGNESNMWNHKIIQLVIALVTVLDEKRSKKDIILNTETIFFYLDLNNLITLYKDNKDVLLSAKEELHIYLKSIPQLDVENNIIGEIALEQHQYIINQFNRALRIIQQIEKMN